MFLLRMYFVSKKKKLPNYYRSGCDKKQNDLTQENVTEKSQIG